MKSVSKASDEVAGDEETEVIGTCKKVKMKKKNKRKWKYMKKNKNKRKWKNMNKNKTIPRSKAKES